MMFFESLERLEPVEHIYIFTASDFLARVCNTVAECRAADLLMYAGTCSNSIQCYAEVPSNLLACLGEVPSDLLTTLDLHLCLLVSTGKGVHSYTILFD